MAKFRTVSRKYIYIPEININGDIIIISLNNENVFLSFKTKYKSINISGITIADSFESKDRTKKIITPIHLRYKLVLLRHKYKKTIIVNKAKTVYKGSVRPEA